MRTIITICMLALLAGSAYAQDPGSTGSPYAPPAWAMINDSLGHVLGLTQDQMKLVQESDEHFSEHVKAGDKNALEQREKDLKAIMLPSQYEQWREMVKLRRTAVIGSGEQKH